jgi:hypothetical protein
MTVWILAAVLYLLLVLINPMVGLLALPYLLPIVVVLFILQLCFDYSEH